LNEPPLRLVRSLIIFQGTKAFDIADLEIGAKCGSVYIDMAFKQWLRQLLGDENYQKLDPTDVSQMVSSHTVQGIQMRDIMKKFDVYKRKFHKGYDDEIKLELPEELEDLNIEGKVLDGELKITN
jgi:hypothetical protein